MKIFTVHTDGGARGNPGPAGIGVAVLNTEGTVVDSLSEFLGTATNNVAEYTAIVRALQHLTKTTKPAETTLHFKLDSQLVERQMNGAYKVKDATLKEYHAKATELTKVFASVTFTYIPREQNKVADKLANEAMDKGA